MVTNLTAVLQDMDRKHHIHPFTDSKSLNEKGVRIITKAEGCHMWTSEGERVLDGMAGLWCVNIGYGRKELADVAYQQMLELPYYNTFFQTSTQPATELSAKLAEITPEGLNHVFYANSGSEANDTIAKIELISVRRGPVGRLNCLGVDEVGNDFNTWAATRATTGPS